MSQPKDVTVTALERGLSMEGCDVILPSPRCVHIEPWNDVTDDVRRMTSRPSNENTLQGPGTESRPGVFMTSQE